MFSWLTHLIAGHPVTYLIVLGVAAGDVLFPLLPSETVVLTAAIVAAQGHLSIVLVIAAAVIGAFAGDNASFWLGRGFGDPIAARLFRGDKAQQRLDWARRAIKSRGGMVVVVGRFIPGGRTASTFAAGTLDMSWPRFARADAFAAVVWALYVGLLGYFGGATFKHSLWKALLLAGAVAVLVALGTELFRRFEKRRGKDLLVNDG